MLVRGDVEGKAAAILGGLGDVHPQIGELRHPLQHVALEPHLSMPSQLLPGGLVRWDPTQPHHLTFAMPPPQAPLLRPHGHHVKGQLELLRGRCQDCYIICKQEDLKYDSE